MIRVSLCLSGHLLEKSAFDRTEIFIGRDPSCDLVIDNLGVSRRHARIFQEAGDWHVEDLGSQNGIYVDETQVATHALLDDDDFAIGKYTIHFENVRSASPKSVEVEQRIAANVTDSVSSPEGVPTGKSLDEYGDHTFALDQKDLQQILSKMRSPEGETRPTAPTLKRLRPATPAFSMKLERSYLILGKVATADIAVHGFWTPRKAALLVHEDGQHSLVSLSTWRRPTINGHRISRQALQDGDVVQVGKTVFRYTVPTE